MSKKKNNRTENESLRQWQKRFTLGRRSAERERRKESDAQERKRVFDIKTSEASDKKAPYTLRTRAYYRFTKEYPSLTDENGFRENGPGKKTVKRRRIVTAVICAAVFVLSYIAAGSCMAVSGRSLPEKPSEAPVDTRPEFRALRLPYDVLKNGDIAEMDAMLKNADCTAAVLEYKDDTGYVMFNTGSFMGMSADRRIKNISSTVKALKAEGYTVCAYISCFRDSAAAEADLTFSVRKNTPEGAAWTDNEGVCWLDPFSPSAVNYLLDLISHAAKDGFDRILLGNVCFPTDSGSAAQYYAFEGETQLSRNQTLVNFIASAVKSSGSAKLTVMCGHTAFDTTGGDETPGYFGNLTECAASSMCADARFSVQPKNTVIGEEKFSDASLMPYVFVLAASEFAVKGASGYENGTREVLVCVDRAPDLSEELTAIEYAGADGYIIW